eukprot:2102721-Rhodomonas_salina.1
MRCPVLIERMVLREPCWAVSSTDTSCGDTRPLSSYALAAVDGGLIAGLVEANTQVSTARKGGLKA